MSGPAPARAPAERARPAAAPPVARTRSSAPPSGRALHTLRAPVARLRDHDPAPPSGLDAEVARTLRAPGLGEPLLPAIRQRLERGLGVDLGALRVHTGERAHAAARRLGARAFTVGRRIYLGERATVHDDALMAHEAAHALQQQSVPIVQRAAGTGGGALEHEAQTAGRTIAGGGTVTISGRATSNTPQREGEDEGWFHRKIMELVRSNAPWLVPIIDKGPIAWLTDQVGDALRGLLDRVMAPVRTVTATITEVKEHVGKLVTWLGEIGGQIAKGDCSGLAAAADKVQQVAEGLASPAIDKIKQVASKIGDFFTGLWADYGAPAWDWLKKAAGKAWDAVTGFVTRLWDSTARVRSLIGWAWHWLLRKLGIEESADDQGGLLAWLKRKASEAWEAIKAKLEPYKKQLAVVAGIVVLLSPAGPVIVVAAAAAGLIKAAQWLAKTFSKPNGIVSERRTLAQEIAPLVKRVTGEVTKAVSKGAAWLVDKLNAVVKGLQGATSSLGDSLLRFLVTAAQWLLDRFQELLAWATEKVNGLAELIGKALARIVVWLQPVLRVLDKVGAVLENILELMILLAEKAWNAIPACVRDPIANFLVEYLLKKIPILKEILEVPDVWAKIKDLARTVIRKIFRGGLDILGAAIAIFKFLLEVLKVPVELAASVFKKAGSAIDVIVENPVKFLKNLLKALAAGFQGFWDNGLKYLGQGVVGWIVGQLPSGVRAPIPFTVGNVFRFVIDVLGISMDKVWKIVEKVAPQFAGPLRAAGAVLSGAWEWLSIAIKEGVAGVWRKFTEKISELKDMVISAVAGFLFGEIVEKAAIKLLSMLDPTGIMAVVNSILLVYDTIRSAIEYMARILAIIDDFLTSVLDVAAGSIGGAAQKIEKGLAAAVPVAIGFLANVLRLGKLSAKVRKAVDKLQAWVEKGLEGLIKAAVKVGGAILKRVGKLLGFRDIPTHEFKQKDGHSHTLSFPATGTVPMVASANPVEVTTFLTKYGTTVDQAEGTALLGQMPTLVNELTSSNAPTEPRRLVVQQAIRDLEVRLGRVLARIFDNNRTLALENWRVEGTTGPYASMQFPLDRMDADHQPHWKLLKGVRDLIVGGADTGDFLFEGKKMRKGDLKALGYSIVVGRPRHALGRTYGGKSHKPAEVALAEIKANLKGKQDDQRKAVMASLRTSMLLDVDAMTEVAKKGPDDTKAWSDIAGDSEAKKNIAVAVSKQIIAGLERVKQQPLDEYGGY